MNANIKRRLHIELDKYSPIFSDDYLHVSFTYLNKEVSVLLDNCYPFRCPVVFYNKQYISYRRNRIPKRLLQEYVQKNGCPCCSSMTCPDNWSPALGIVNILREYETFMDTLKMYQKIRMTKYLQLPDDMIYVIITFLD